MYCDMTTCSRGSRKSVATNELGITRAGFMQASATWEPHFWSKCPPVHSEAELIHLFCALSSAHREAPPVLAT